MFDINEYYQNYNTSSKNNDSIYDIDTDITDDLKNLLKNRFSSLYSNDCYRNKNHAVDIIYPKLSYPGNRSLIITSDKIRHLLSFYPKKSDLMNLNKIVIRPRYIELNKTELVSLYLNKEKILVLYLSHPYFYRLDQLNKNEYMEHLFPDKEMLMKHKFNEKNFDDVSNNYFKIHPLWYFIIIISLNKNIESETEDENRRIDKFFIKKDLTVNSIYHALNDMTFYFSRNGY